MGIRNFFLKGWGFDHLYDTVFVKPFLFITRINKADVFDKLYNGIAKANQAVESFIISFSKRFTALVYRRCVDWDLIHIGFAVIVVKPHPDPAVAGPQGIGLAFRRV